VRLNISAHADGGPSRGSSMRRTGSDVPMVPADTDIFSQLILLPIYLHQHTGHRYWYFHFGIFAPILAYNHGFQPIFGQYRHTLISRVAVTDTTNIQFADHPYITSSLLGCHLTPTHPIVINRYIWYNPPLPLFAIVVLSYFNPCIKNHCYVEYSPVKKLIGFSP
jgi:hypothetical protein